MGSLLTATLSEPALVIEAAVDDDRSRVHVGSVVARFALPFLLALSAGFFSLWSTTSEVFFSRANLDNLLADQTVVTVMALAIMVPLVSGGFDFSVGATTGVAAVATATSLDRFGLPVGAAIAIAIFAGLLIGAINGISVARLGLNPFIFTLAMATVTSGLVQWYTNGLSINARRSSVMVNLGSGKWLTLPATMYVLVVVAGLVWYVLEHTPFGRRLRAHGVNPEAARLVGIDVNAVVIRAMSSRADWQPSPASS